MEGMAKKKKKSFVHTKNILFYAIYLQVVLKGTNKHVQAAIIKHCSMN